MDFYIKNCVSNIETNMLTSFNRSMKQFRRSRFWLPGAARYVSRKCRLLWIIGPGIDASWKFPTRKSQSRIPVANRSARYVYESILPCARSVYLEIIPYNAAAGLEEIYRRNVPRNKCTSVKNAEAKFHKKMRGKIRLCAHRCSITKLRRGTAFKNLVFRKCPPDKFKFCYANKRDLLLTDIINIVRNFSWNSYMLSRHLWVSLWCLFLITLGT